MRHLVVALAAVSCVACGGGSSAPTPTPTPTPTKTNQKPVINSMTVTPFGISDLGTFQGTVSASDPEGDSVSYAWTIGGLTANGSSWTKTLTGDGTYTATVTVTDSNGASASDSRTFVVGSMSGNWTGIAGPPTLAGFRFSLTQTLSIVTGTYHDDTYGGGSLDPAEPGRVDVNGKVKMRVKQGRYTDWYFNGTLDPSGRRVTGTVRGSGFTDQPFAMVK